VNLNHQERPFTISALICFPLRASQRERLKQRLEHEPASLAIALAPSGAIQAQGCPQRKSVEYLFIHITAT
jgi:hypothetical protein